MLSRSSLLHLRVPFSYFLLPIFLFALSISPNFTASGIFWTFFIVHFLLYPASNGYNSYFDKDEGSIGVLRNPPPVDRGLYYLSLFLDVLAIVLALLFVNLTFAVMLMVYGLISKSYSHPIIRLKKYAIASWIVVGAFQGLFTFVMCYVGINGYGFQQGIAQHVVVPGTLSTLQLLATYPITQIYQHDEDARRGDVTMSLILGIKGTFFFVSMLYILVAIAFVWYFTSYHTFKYAIFYLLISLPVVTYFFIWMLIALRRPQAANYKATMRLTWLSATSLNIFFIYFWLDRTHLLQN